MLSYYIAVASSDGKNIDTSFGAATKFFIYQVTNDSYELAMIRNLENNLDNERVVTQVEREESRKNRSCSSGCGGGSCCGNSDMLLGKLSQVQDCRCVICSKIGFQVRKHLEKKAISAFDVETGIEEAMKKITSYFAKTDQHISLRNSHAK